MRSTSLILLLAGLCFNSISCGQEANGSNKQVQLIEAAYTGNTKTVIALVKRGVKVNSTLNESQIHELSDIMPGFTVLSSATPLKAALSQQNDLIAAYLLGSGATCTNSVSYRAGYSELFYLVQRKTETQNMLVLAKMLIYAGADPAEKISEVSKLEDMNLNGKTIQQIALQKGHKKLAKLIDDSIRATDKTKD